MRNRVAELLRFWCEKEVSPVARQATVTDLASVAPSMPAEILAVAEALMKVATKPQAGETAATLLETLPQQLGLPLDSLQWSEQALDQALAHLESACQFLKDFNKLFKKYVAEEVGICFGLTEQSKNWDNVLKAALEWRTTTVKRVRGNDLVGMLDGRDLIFVLDDNPRSFEQVFLNTLPYRLKLTIFEQWQTIRICGEYLQRLKQAKADIEAKAVELEPPVVIEVSPKQTNELDRGAKPLIIIPSPEPTRGNDKSQFEPTIDAEGISDIPVYSGGIDVSPDGPLKPLEPEIPKQTSSVIMKSVVDEAFFRITKIINQLSPKDQITLWNRLVNEYDPR